MVSTASTKGLVEELCFTGSEELHLGLNPQQERSREIFEPNFK